MTTRVTEKEVERVAELANLELEPQEAQSMLHDLNAILDYVAQLNELDTSGVAPLAQVTELEGAEGEAFLRSDTQQPSLARTAVLSQAPDTDQVFFKVPKVIER
ncbi:MAG TPA: Asp-tRNA(Asn)/Glu-tRNA(Gln) amidotransferase subunit GatC [Terracidiphilus sp.]|jgi:aspartyl-tRNA(Asn)/glutamyl-tRNA(Gln) amidotransferase subunit C|nr:Asp-tRNA(Asn)/Glu-tRNA(Gln) amidotransferase subunit GatC [Terracidiphilus sp.]